MTNLKWSFIGAIIVGTSLITILIRQSHFKAAIVSVLAIMALFGVLLWVRSAKNIASENDGDTFYYLGFIYTLATLAASFLPFLFRGQESKLDVRQVLGYFGLGLLTTFVGLAGRIFFSQFREEPGSAFDRALAGLADGINRLSLQLDLAIDYTGRARQRSDQEMLRLQEVFAKHFQDVTNSHNRHFEELTISATARIEEIVGSFADQIKSFSEAIDAAKGAVLQNTGSITEANRILAQDLKTMSATSKKHIAALEKTTPLLDEWQRAAKKPLEEFAQAVKETSERIAQTLDGLALINARFDAIQTTAQGILESYETLLQTTGDSARQFASVNAQAFDKLRESYGALLTQMTEDIEAIKSHRIQLQSELAASTEATIKVHQGLVDAVHTVITKLG